MRVDSCQGVANGFEERTEGCISGGPGDGELGGDASGDFGLVHVVLRGDREWTTIPTLLATLCDDKVSAATLVEMSDFLIRWLLEVNPVLEGGSECSSGAFRPPGGP